MLIRIWLSIEFPVGSDFPSGIWKHCFIVFWCSVLLRIQMPLWILACGCDLFFLSQPPPSFAIQAWWWLSPLFILFLQVNIFKNHHFSSILRENRCKHMFSILVTFQICPFCWYAELGGSVGDNLRKEFQCLLEETRAADVNQQELQREVHLENRAGYTSDPVLYLCYWNKVWLCEAE